MYEKIINYYEENLCIDNMFFRKYYKRWIIGIIVMLVLMVLINYSISLLIENLWTKIIINLIINVVMVAMFLILIYIPALMKIYKQKVKEKTKVDVLGMLMNQDKLGEYRKVEIKEMETFLRKECKIKDLTSIDMIIEEIDKEIKDKYQKKNIIEKSFNNVIVPLIIALLPVYFANNNEQQLFQIFFKSLIVVMAIIITQAIFFEMTDIKLFIPIDKKENLLELQRVLLDIKIKWSKKN